MENENSRGALKSIDSLFSDSWKLFTERASTLYQILFLPVLTIFAGVMMGMVGFPFTILAVLFVVAGFVLFVFAVVAMIVAIKHGGTIESAYAKSWKLFWPVVWVSILHALVILGGVFMAIIPAIWLSVALFPVSYILVLEGRRGMDALRQSRDYVKEYWWAIFGRMVLLSLIMGGISLVSFMAQVPFLLFHEKLIAIGISDIIALGTIPFSLIYSYKIFENLQHLKPHLVDAHPKTGKGFLIASAIIGIVGSILAVFVGALIIIALALFAASHQGQETCMSPGPCNDYTSSPLPGGMQPPMNQNLYQ